MSGGESDALYYRTVFVSHLCEVNGCEWNVSSAATRCADHGGDPTQTLWITSETGETTYHVATTSPFAEDAADEGDPIG